jgi:hypothetical protein
MNAAELKKWEYQTDTAIMLPYSERHVHVYPESFLAKVYFQLKDDGTLDKIFPGMGVLHLNRFLGYLPKCHGLVMCCLKNPDPTHQPRVVGFGWLTEIDIRPSPIPHKASFGFGFFKEVWGTQDNIDLSRFMLAHWMRELNVDTLWGTTLKSNRLAVRYSQHFGFNVLCNLPHFFLYRGALADATFMVLERDKFLPSYEAWKQEYGWKRSEPVRAEHAEPAYAGTDRPSEAAAGSF